MKELDKAWDEANKRFDSGELSATEAMDLIINCFVDKMVDVAIDEVLEAEMMNNLKDMNRC